MSFREIPTCCCANFLLYKVEIHARAATNYIQKAFFRTAECELTPISCDVSPRMWMMFSRSRDLSGMHRVFHDPEVFRYPDVPPLRWRSIFLHFFFHRNFDTYLRSNQFFQQHYGILSNGAFCEQAEFDVACKTVIREVG